MNWYLNNNFLLVIKTLTFLLFDLYVIEYDTELTNEQINTIYEGLKNNSTDIDELINITGAYILSEAIDDIKTDLVYQSYDLCYKEYGSYNINTSNLYNFYVGSTTKTTICAWIKKFDNLNYIMPLMVSLDNKYITDVNKYVELEKLMNGEEQLKNLNNLIINYNNFILY